MKRRLATSLRAHFVLLAASILIAAVPVCALYVLFDLLDAGEPPDALAALVLFALTVMLVLRLSALRAYRAARLTNHVRPLSLAEHKASLVPDCERGWFVQLHLELMGYECID